MRTILAATLGMLTAGGLFAQSAAAPLKFEVASIKPSAPDARGTSLLLQPPNGVRVTNAPLRMLITFAYDVRDFQISGGPGWLGSERYDIQAKADPAPGSENVPDDPRKMTDQQRTTKLEEMKERVRALLTDRFQLTIHRETKEAPVYALVVAKGGAKLQAAKDAGDGPQGLRMGRGQLTGMGAPLQMLANILSSQLGRPVVDKTALTGKYDFKLEWTPDAGQGGGPAGPLPPGVDQPPPPDPNGPTLFTAIQEQLGLRLESQRGPMEMIVIDHVEKASEN
jgi:bla regulator protein BlaR1